MRLGFLLTVLVSFHFPFAFAGTVNAPPIASCEYGLVSAFQGAPNDHSIGGWQGLVTDKVPITVETLVAGYRRGLFAFADESGMGRWYNPPIRGILRLEKAHFGSRLERWIKSKLKSGELRVTHDQAFERVIQACADLPRADGWITKTHIQQYTKLHYAGFAHSVEVWKGEELIGGLYIVYVDGVPSGESMFQLDPKSNAMKVGYYSLKEHLRAKGHKFIDTQMNIGLTKMIGGEDIPRYEFMQLVKDAQMANRPY